MCAMMQKFLMFLDISGLRQSSRGGDSFATEVAEEFTNILGVLREAIRLLAKRSWQLLGMNLRIAKIEDSRVGVHLYFAKEEVKPDSPGVYE